MICIPHSDPHGPTAACSWQDFGGAHPLQSTMLHPYTSHAHTVSQSAAAPQPSQRRAVRSALMQRPSAPTALQAHTRAHQHPPSVLCIPPYSSSEHAARAAPVHQAATHTCSLGSLMHTFGRPLLPHLNNLHIHVPTLPAARTLTPMHPEKASICTPHTAPEAPPHVSRTRMLFVQPTCIEQPLHYHRACTLLMQPPCPKQPHTPAAWAVSCTHSEKLAAASNQPSHICADPTCCAHARTHTARNNIHLYPPYCS